MHLYCTDRILYQPTTTLHRNRSLTENFVHSYFLKKTNSVWFISRLNYGDTENGLIKHLLLVIPVSYSCHYTNLCPHKPHKHVHMCIHTLTHTHTHTHTLRVSSRAQRRECVEYKSPLDWPQRALISSVVGRRGAELFLNLCNQQGANPCGNPAGKRGTSANYRFNKSHEETMCACALLWPAASSRALRCRKFKWQAGQRIMIWKLHF